MSGSPHLGGRPAAARALASGLYEGVLRHRRFGAVRHALRMPLYMTYLDLDELDRAFAGSLLWSARRPAAAWFRREDHLGARGEPLDHAVRDLVAARTGRRPRGPVRVLTHLRTLGFCFNPVSFFYCFAEAAPGDGRPPGGEELEAVVAEVTNTPWGERHAYVIGGDARAHGGGIEGRHAKELHVSPFLGPDLEYAWRFGLPGERLSVEVRCSRAGALAFEGSLELERRELSPRAMRAAFFRHPAMSLKVFAQIYYHAASLWLKRAPFHPHPSRRRPSRAGGG